MHKYSLDQAKKDTSSSVYVLNVISKTNRDKANSVIVFDIMVEANGTSKAVMLPITFIPVDLAMQVPKEAILRSTNFLQALNQKFIVLVDPEEAMALFEEDEDAKLEQIRLINKLNGMTDEEEESDEENEDDDNPMKLFKDPTPDREQVEAKDMAKKLSEIHPKAIDLCTNDTLKPDEAMSVVKTYESQFTWRDFKYLTTNLPGKARSDRLMEIITAKAKKPK